MRNDKNSPDGYGESQSASIVLIGDLAQMAPRDVPIVSYLLFLFGGHLLAAATPRPGGVLLLTTLGVLLPLSSLVVRDLMPISIWRLWTIVSSTGAALLVAGVTWENLLTQPNNDLGPLFIIVPGHVAVITAFLKLRSNASTGRRV